MKLDYTPDKYILFFESERHPGNRWRLWTPECLIFDADLQRGRMNEAPQWQRQGDALTVTGEGEDDAGHKAWLRFTYTPQGDDLALAMEVRNTGERAWTDYAHPALCLSNEYAPTFADPEGDRTFVVSLNDDVRTVPDLMPEAVKRKFESLPQAERDHANRYNHFPVGGRNDADDRLQKFPVGAGWIGRWSADKTQTLYFTWDRVARVDTNFNVMTCLHSHPAMGPLKPGASVACKGLIAIRAGDPAAAYSQVPAALKGKP